jgi:S1-C subfamily serine protease
MKKLLILATLFLPFTAFAQQKNIPEYLQNISVSVKTEGGEGSGVLFTRKDAQGNNLSFIVTAAHVLADARTVREVLTPQGGKKFLVEFKNPLIVKHVFEGGRKVGRIEMESEVIKYSDAEYGEDLGILKVVQKNFSTETAVLNKDLIVPIGTEVFHVGSMKGEIGYNSLTTGIISSIGRVIGNKQVFDQTSVTANFGSSGCGLYLKTDGSYVGQIQLTGGAGFFLMKPNRVIREWAKVQKVEWVFDPAANYPNDEELRKLPIEDVK